MPNLNLPDLTTGDATLDAAFRIALGDLAGNVRPFAGNVRPFAGNVRPFQDGLLDEPAPVILAGLEYDRPWTRDAAINTWNGAGLLLPEISRTTLRSVLIRNDHGLRIGGQYWDAIIWTVGAWATYTMTGDRDMVATALAATRNSLAYFEATEFDPDLGLFRGPACYGDGVAAYPAVYANAEASGILDWPAANPGRTAEKGYGIPMHALSTNCLYQRAYVLAGEMARELGERADPAWAEKARALKAAINHHFWNPATGAYRYLIDPFGGCDHQEGMGHALALLFGIADDEQAAAVLERQHVTPAGVPCVWPTFPRYLQEPDAYGRHSGTVWPHIQGLWATAALAHGAKGRFDAELHALAEHAVRDAQFAEIYHPTSGAIYGGLQEDGGQGIRLWHSCHRQTWSATAFLRMILQGVVGMAFEPEGVAFRPHLPPGCREIVLRNVPYRDAQLSIRISAAAPEGDDRVTACTLNGTPLDRPYLPSTATGPQRIAIQLT